MCGKEYYGCLTHPRVIIQSYLQLVNYSTVILIFITMVIITMLSGCSAALKMVGEMFRWSQNSQFCYLLENHNSVLGIREYAASSGASLRPMTVEELLQMNHENGDSQ